MFGLSLPPVVCMRVHVLLLLLCVCLWCPTHTVLYFSSSCAINKLRVKLATGQDASLVRLPPSEAALRQHILRDSFQTKVWHSCLAKPPLSSPMEYGWRTVKDSLHLVYFEGNMSAEFLVI